MCELEINIGKYVQEEVQGTANALTLTVSDKMEAPMSGMIDKHIKNLACP